MLESFDFNDFVILIVCILYSSIFSISQLLLEITDKALVLLIEKVSLSVTNNDLYDFLIIAKLNKVMLKRYII